MSKQLPLALYAALSFVMLQGSGIAVAQSFTTINYPEATGTRPFAISGGNVVGSYFELDGYHFDPITGDFSPIITNHGFLYDGSSYTSIDYPGAVQTFGNAISGSNVVGYYQNSDGTYHGFLYDGSSYTSIDYPAASNTFGNAVSGSNVLGDYRDSAGINHGFLYDGSSYSSIDYPGASGTSGVAISGSNIIGQYSTDSNSFDHGFYYDGSSYTSIEYPGAVSTVLGAVSGSSIAGNYRDSDGVNHLFRFDGSSYATIESPRMDDNTLEFYPRGIAGNTIVGFFTNWNSDYLRNDSHGFISNGEAVFVIDVAGARDTYIEGIDGNHLIGYSQDNAGNPSGFIIESAGLTQQNPNLPLLPSDIPPEVTFSPPAPNLIAPDDVLGPTSTFIDMCLESPFTMLDFNPLTNEWVCVYIYDPPLASGFLYQAQDGANFLEVGMPTGLGDHFLVADGINAPGMVAAGATYFFPLPVSSFTVTGIDPPVDGGSATAFPTLLGLDVHGAYFTMTPISAVPESSTLLLAACGMIAVGCISRWRAKRQRPRPKDQFVCRGQWLRP